MFRQRDQGRTFRQNIRLAVFLSFTAGLVNISGLLALGVLTTNVTGHFAYFSEALQKKDILLALNFLIYILSFLLGSFVSSFITEYYLRKGSHSAYHAAIFMEIALLSGIGMAGDFLVSNNKTEIIACLLLFSMGSQNALVTHISKSVVRTTHLTGLFTDLGIELSQLFFYTESVQLNQLKKSIGLRSFIIAFFFLGCVIGGYLFHYLKFGTLIIAAGILLIALGYSKMRIIFFRHFRKRKQNVRTVSQL